MADLIKTDIGISGETRAADYREIYCNWSKTRVSPWDISLIVSKIQNVANGPPVAEEQVTIIFSPQQFKAVAMALNSAIAAYEGAFGTVNLPPGMTGSISSDQITQAMEQAASATTKKD